MHFKDIGQDSLTGGLVRDFSGDHFMNSSIPLLQKFFIIEVFIDFLSFLVLGHVIQVGLVPGCILLSEISYIFLIVLIRNHKT